MSDVLVLGLGKSGRASASYALERGDDVTVYAGSPDIRDAACALEEMGAEVIFDDEDVKGSHDLCIVSPGIPQTSAFYRSAESASRELVSEPEYAWRNSRNDWIAVTGTNGKTTTTSLIRHLLVSCGMDATACGNIGDTCIEAVRESSGNDVLVAEMSSYQLASTVRFKPKVAVLLNITPDHISWHGSFDAYADAKMKVFSNMDGTCHAVLTKEVIEAFPSLKGELAGKGVEVLVVGEGDERTKAFEKDGGLFYVDGKGDAKLLVSVDDLPIKGEHNVENALCASCAAMAYGCGIDGVREGLATFAPLEHRLEPCGVIDGVEYFNDSKATNVDATLKALTAFSDGEVVLLLGGRDKNTDLGELVEAARRACSAVITYGEASRRFHEAFEGSGLAVHEEDGMREAFHRARSIAREGQAVVLSPACASFDEFDSFEQRGRAFKESVSMAQRV